MFVNQPDDAQLVALWHDPETCPAIARRLGVSQTWLTLQWRRLRQQDRLPTDRRRNASDGADGRPTIKTRDRLLKRLIAVHGEPRFDLFNSRRATCS
jgi:transposase-like protein